MNVGFSLLLLQGEMFPFEKISTHPPLLLPRTLPSWAQNIQRAREGKHATPACLRARESEVQGRGGGAYIQHASSRSRLTYACTHARVYDLPMPKDCSTFRLSCPPSHFIASSSPFSSGRRRFPKFQCFGLGPAASRRPSAVRYHMKKVPPLLMIT